MKWNIRFLRVAMWIFRLLALLAVVYGVASIFFYITILSSQQVSASYNYSQLIHISSALDPRLTRIDPLYWIRTQLPRVLAGLLIALIFLTLASLISLNLRFYAAMRSRTTPHP